MEEMDAVFGEGCFTRSTWRICFLRLPLQRTDWRLKKSRRTRRTSELHCYGVVAVGVRVGWARTMMGVRQGLCFPG